jgi:hypothetical protein
MRTKVDHMGTKALFRMVFSVRLKTGLSLLVSSSDLLSSLKLNFVRLKLGFAFQRLKPFVENEFEV